MNLLFSLNTVTYKRWRIQLFSTSIKNPTLGRCFLICVANCSKYSVFFRNYVNAIHKSFIIFSSEFLETSFKANSSLVTKKNTWQYLAKGRTHSHPTDLTLIFIIKQNNWFPLRSSSASQRLVSYASWRLFIINFMRNTCKYFLGDFCEKISPCLKFFVRLGWIKFKVYARENNNIQVFAKSCSSSSH